MRGECKEAERKRGKEMREKREMKIRETRGSRQLVREQK